MRRLTRDKIDLFVGAWFCGACTALAMIGLVNALIKGFT